MTDLLQDMRLRAIWLPAPVIKSDGSKSVRLTAGDIIRMDNNKIVDCLSINEYIGTHVVLKCSGGIATLYGQAFEVQVQSLATGKITTLKL